MSGAEALSEDEPSSRLTGGRLTLLASLAALGVLATNIILPAFPPISRDLSVDPRDLPIWPTPRMPIFMSVFSRFIRLQDAPTSRECAAGHSRPRQ